MTLAPTVVHEQLFATAVGILLFCLISAVALRLAQPFERGYAPHGYALWLLWSAGSVSVVLMLFSIR